MDARLRLLLDAYFAQQRALDRLEEVVFIDSREQNMTCVDMFSALEFGYGVPEARMLLRLLTDVVRSRIMEVSSALAIEDFDEVSFREFMKKETIS